MKSADRTYRIPFKACGMAVALWAAWILVVYFQHLPFSGQPFVLTLRALSDFRMFHPYALKILEAIAFIAWFLWCAHDAGQRLLRRMVPVQSFLILESIVFAMGLGLAAMTMAVWILGALHLWNIPVFAGLLIALTIASWYKPARLRGELDFESISGDTFNHGVLGMLGLLILFILFSDFAPTIFYDSLSYHLAIPNQYRLAGGIINIPTMMSSNLTLTVQMLYGVALTLSNAIAANLLHGAFAVLLALSYLAFGQRYLKPGAGALAALLFLGMPMVGLYATTAGVDVGWCFFQFLAAYALVRSLEEKKPSWFIWAGLLTGLAASCRYQGFIALPVAGLIILWKRRRHDKATWKMALQDLAYFLAAEMVMVSPGLIRNTLFNHNPLYPFGGTHWGTPLIDPARWRLIMADGLSTNWHTILSSPAQLLHFVLHPWFLTMNGLTLGEPIGPLLLIALPLLILVRPSSRALSTLTQYGILLWGLAIFNSGLVRYGIASLALLTPALAEAWETLTDTRFKKTIGLLIVAIATTSNASVLCGLVYVKNGWNVVEGMTSEAEYLSDMQISYNPPPYEGLVWINDHLSTSAKILMVGEARSYYLNRKAVLSSVWDPQPIVQYSQQSKTGAEMADRLRQDGITHLFLNMPEAVHTQGYGLFAWTKPDWQTFEEFWTHNIRLVWKSEHLIPGHPKALYIYEVLSPAEAKQPHEAPPNPFERWAPHATP